MITRNEVLTALENKGYQVKLDTYSKNGITLYGISLADREVSPVIYIDEILEKANENKMGIQMILTFIEDIFDQNNIPELDLDKLKDKNFVKQHLYIGLQKKSDTDIIKKDCFIDDLEQYLYVSLGGPMYVKLTKPLLYDINLFEDMAWIIAEENTNKNTTLDAMQDLIQMEEIEGLEMPNYYVLSNRSRVYGAASILNKKRLQTFAEETNIHRVVVLPSSIHELILVPVDGDVDLDTMSQMVHDVNQNNVDPKEQLLDYAFVLDI